MVKHRAILTLWGQKKGSNLPPFHVNWIRLTAFDDWHNNAYLILHFTLLGSLVRLTHHLNLLLLHPILAHLRILANAHLITGTLLRDAITYMASHNVKLLHASKIGNFFKGGDTLTVGVIPPDLRKGPPTETEIF